MAYGRCVIYPFAGDAQEMIEKARAGSCAWLEFARQ